MKKILSLAFISLLSFSGISATTYYVSPDGTTSATGTKSNPLYLTTAIGKTLVAGDSVILRGGMYSFSSTQSITKSGSASGFIHIVAYPGETPVLDFRKQAYNSSNPGVKVSGSYVHIKGITVQGAGDNGMIVTGSNNFIETCSFRWNCDSGLQMKTGSNNYILNCDSYENFDYETGGTSSPDYGGNADGFADKQYSNTGTNTYKGCRSWRNSDDGWDHFQKIGNSVYDSCWCYANGPLTYDMKNHIRFSTDSASWFVNFASTNYVVTNYGNGNGFKMGGEYTAHNVTAHHCVAVSNKVKGFDQNNNAGTMNVYNCTGYINQYNYGYSNSSYGTLVIKNCASLSGTKSNTLNCKSVTQSNNSWLSGFSCAATDFQSLDYTQLLNDRQSDGSLPEISLLHQKSTSSMIDKGISLGYAFSGSAPDLGAFEYLVSTPVFTPEAESAVKVYYSAAVESILVEGAVADVQVYNISGRLIYANRTQTNDPEIPTNNWTNGVYVVRVVTQDGKPAVVKVLIP